MTSRPCAASSSRRSLSSLVNTAVDDMANAPPMDTPACQVNPVAKDRPVTTASVTSTCSKPNPNTMRFMATSLGSENSRPIENIRKTTPNSAR